jgi:agmatine deiminase
MSQLLQSTPRADGFFMPAEWSPHAGCWMLFPTRTDNWRDGARPAQAAFATVARAIARFEPVTIGAAASCYGVARALMPPSVRVVEMSSNDAWMRDAGATFVVNGAGQVRGVDWIFNAWGGLQGGLYFPWDQDDLVARKLLDLERCDRYRAPFVTEGGALHVDGEGTLLLTRQSILNSNRNPDLSEAQLEQLLRDYLNVQHIIWIDEGVYADETDGHIDNLCCFVRPGVVALTWTDDRSDPQYRISQAAYETLMQATDARGRRLQVHKIHQPDPLTMTAAEAAGIDVSEGSQPRVAGARLAASYVNFYIANGAVIVPTFDDAHDRAALQTLGELFPQREVVAVPGREILLGGGNVHCITQQQPAG